ncbi:YgjV family protein [Brenneria sp. 4F2]|nr:YgjV family protein [Brenneria bubanii]
MTHYWFAQSVGVLAFLVGITLFFNRNDQKFKIQLSVYSAMIGCHFFLMAANAAGSSALLNAVRTLVSIKTHNIWLGSIGGSMIEGSFLLMNGFNIIRFWRMQKRGIDPFKGERKEAGKA